MTDAAEHIERLEAMAEDNGQTWDLSDNDRTAIKFILEEFDRLHGEINSLKADAARRYILKSDCDGHWYVVPADKDREAAEYFEAVSKYWDEPSDDNATEPDRPDWLEEVGGCPSLVTFTNPQTGAGF